MYCRGSGLFHKTIGSHCRKWGGGEDLSHVVVGVKGRGGGGGGKTASPLCTPFTNTWMSTYTIDLFCVPPIQLLRRRSRCTSCVRWRWKRDETNRTSTVTIQKSRYDPMSIHSGQVELHAHCVLGWVWWVCAVAPTC